MINGSYLPNARSRVRERPEMPECGHRRRGSYNTLYRHTSMLLKILTHTLLHMLGGPKERASIAKWRVRSFLDSPVTHLHHLPYPVISSSRRTVSPTVSTSRPSTSTTVWINYRIFRIDLPYALLEHVVGTLVVHSVHLYLVVVRRWWALKDQRSNYILWKLVQNQWSLIVDYQIHYPPLSYHTCTTVLFLAHNNRFVCPHCYLSLFYLSMTHNPCPISDQRSGDGLCEWE